MTKMKFQEVEGIYLNRISSEFLRNCAFSQFELGGFLYGAVRDSQLYLVEGFPVMDSYSIAFSRSKSRVEFNDNIFLQREELRKIYKQIPGSVSIVWHSHPEIQIEGKVTAIDELSPEDVDFINKYSEIGLALLLSTSGRKMVETPREHLHSYTIIDPNENPFLHIGITGFQIENGNIHIIPIYEVDSNYSYSLEKKLSDIRNEFQITRKKLGASTKNEDMIVFELSQFFK